MPHKSMRVAGLQMLVDGKNIAANEQRIKAGIKRAAADKIDFLLTPEGSLSGYNNTFDRRELERALGRVTRAAKTAGVGLLLGTCYKWQDGRKGPEFCANQVRVYAPDGAYLGQHSKILRCSPIDRPGTGEMMKYVEGVLRVFEWKGICFGALVCNDMWATPHCTTMPNPHLALKLKQMGARIIFHAIHSGADLRYQPYHESTVEIRARSLEMHIVECNAARQGMPINARSGLVLPDGTRPEIVDPEGEAYFKCTIRP